MKKRFLVLIATLLCVSCSCKPVEQEIDKNINFMQNSIDDNSVKIYFPNVCTNIPGRNDQGAVCVLIKYKSINILIDAATKHEGCVNYIENLLDEHGVTRLDHVILTHPHGDHAGGLPRIIEDYDVGRLYTKPIDWKYVSQEMHDHYDGVYLAAKYKVNSDASYPKIINPHREGYHYDLDSEGYFEIYNCTKTYDDLVPGTDDNFYSMQIKFTYKNSSAFFGGDCASNADEFIMNKIGHCDIFQLQHHGDALPYNSQFIIDELSPTYAIVECVEWKRSEGFPIDRPEPTTVDRLVRGGVKKENILTVGTTGDLEFISDGNTFTLVK